MSLSDMQKSFIVSYSMQLLQQDMLTNYVFAKSAFGASLRGMVLPSSKVKTYTDPSAQALNSRLRLDSRSLSQAAANVKEASSLYGVMSTATGSIGEKLDEMLQILKDKRDGLINANDAKTQYKTLYDEAVSVAKFTSFNGMLVLKGSAWEADGNIQAPPTAGDPGTIHIQTGDLGKGGFNVTLYDVEDILTKPDNAKWLPGNAWSGNIQNVIEDLEKLNSRVSSLHEIYKSRQAGLAAQAASMQDQADILAQAAVKRSARVATSEDVFIDYVLGAIGSIINEKS